MLSTATDQVSMGQTVPAPETRANHSDLKRDYLNYIDVKQNEIREQQDARRYYHGSQWTKEQIATFNKRKQPVVTFNRIGRKLNALVGLLERQKRDPKGFPRTPQHEEGAEIATAVLRYVCDQQRWDEKSPLAGLNGGVDGIGGVEILLEQGDVGDTEVAFEVADPSGFFYDPRSMKPDFSDARYMGIGKWADVETVAEMFPEKADEIRASAETGGELTSDPDSDQVWYQGTERKRLIRLVDHWYIKGGEWHWCIYTGSMIILSGVSYLKDEKKRTVCKYIMFSANVDQDGDRYGFVRNMRSAQDEINQRRSKGLHQLNSRRMVIAKGSGDDIEQLRREAVRPDGVIEYTGLNPPTFDDNAKGQELQGQLAFLEDAKNEIENYGFNPALVGQGVDKLSGKAMQIQQDAGIAELGPYLLSYRAWKLRVYRAIWNAVREHWTAERWIRVTDDDGVAQFIGVNQMGVDPSTGLPAMVNALGALDVDIILDEGPDTINMQQDAYDTMTVMAQRGVQVPPELLLELSNLPGKTKKKALDILEQAKQQAAQPNPLAIAGAQAEIADKQAAAVLKQAQAQKAMADAGAAGMGGQQGPSEIEIAKALAEIRATNAGIEKTMAETDKIQVETALKPVEMRQKAQQAEQQRQDKIAMQRSTTTQ